MYLDIFSTIFNDSSLLSNLEKKQLSILSENLWDDESNFTINDCATYLNILKTQYSIKL